MIKQGISLTREQYRILEALSACAKVSAQTRQWERTPYFDADMSGRLELLAAEADKLEIPWPLQNQVYYQAGLDPWSYNRVTIERALRITYKNKETEMLI